jgi:hypothetical protein
MCYHISPADVGAERLSLCTASWSLENSSEMVKLPEHPDIKPQVPPPRRKVEGQRHREETRGHGNNPLWTGTIGSQVRWVHRHPLDAVQRLNGHRLFSLTHSCVSTGGLKIQSGSAERQPERGFALAFCMGHESSQVCWELKYCVGQPAQGMPFGEESIPPSQGQPR